jgi:hypothetical protein
VTLIVVCGADVLAPGAALAGTLDQQQTNIGGFDLFINSTQSLAQTFTAGLSGGLDQVDLNLRLQTGTTPTAPLNVEIRDVNGGVPGVAVLASSSVPASSVPASAAFVSVSFATPAFVVAGTQYSIVADSSTAQTNSYDWLKSSTANPYAAGDAFSKQNSPPGAWTPGFGDWAFKTYVALPMTTTGTPPAGQRAAAVKKCKKKFHKNHNKKRFQKCKKNANLLPV